jgi:hypothetical protein
MGFLVAQLPADTDRGKQESYVQAIKGLAAQSQDLQSVRVSLLERPLPADLEGQQAEALKLGRRLGASFVLRPVPVQSGNVVVWLTRVPLPAQEGGATDRFHTPMECPLPGNPQIVAKSCVLVALMRGSLCGRVEEELQELLESPDFADEAAAFLICICICICICRKIKKSFSAGQRPFERDSLELKGALDSGWS